MARDGLDGLSAYEIARQLGFKGSAQDWLASLRGAAGADGRSVDRAEVEAMVKAAVEAIERPRDGTDGRDGRDGRDGIDGRIGAPGIDGKAAGDSAPAVPHVARFTRDEDTKRTVLMRVEPVSGIGQAWNVVPNYVDGVMAEAWITPA
jgi:hypothetical protein